MLQRAKGVCLAPGVLGWFFVGCLLVLGVFWLRLAPLGRSHSPDVHQLMRLFQSARDCDLESYAFGAWVSL
jgi:hypothetical protein